MGFPDDIKKVKTYDAKKVIVNYGGAPIKGFDDGDFVEIKAAADRWSKKVGADGEVARSRGNDETSEVTLTLSQTSPANLVLDAFMEADRLTSLGILPLTIVDTILGTTFFWPQAWIKKVPDTSRGKELKPIKWVFDTGQNVAEIISGDGTP
jgi:hypothetical protein